MVATLNTTVIQNASSSTANITLDTAGNVTGGANLVATGMPYGSSSFLRNRIINGNMVIDQRNAGASGTASAYTVDRWNYAASQASKGTWGQNLNSVTLPTGFTNYLGFQTAGSSYSVTSTDYFALYQPIEGYNISDWAWGTANAKTVTLSFQVYSSLTGTFGGALKNNAGNYSYPYTYTISSANTWTTISITITGPTSGTWLTTNGNGVSVQFGLGVGTTYSGTAGSWSANNYLSATGATSVVGTASATFYITGVQLEQGSVATPFERPLYSKQLADCQRYCYVCTTRPLGITLNGNALYSGILSYPVTMRASPTLSNASCTVSGGSVGTPALQTSSGQASTLDAAIIYNSANNWNTNAAIAITGTFSAEL